RQITPQIFPRLLALLEGDLDRSRLRVAVVLHGEVVSTDAERVLHASRLGKETLDLIGQAIPARRPQQISPTLPTPSIQSGRRRYGQKVLSWLRHQLVFDDPELLAKYLAEVAAGRPVAQEVVRLVEACSAGALKVLGEFLRPDQPAPVQRVLLSAAVSLIEVW